MVHRSATLTPLALTTLVVLSLVFAPLSGLGQIKAEGERLCIKTVHVGTEPCCCDKPADAPSPCTTSPESNPAPCGHSDDCSCCIKICCTVILAPIERSDHSLIKQVVEIVPMADQTPADSRWRDPLLRPPIC